MRLILAGVSVLALSGCTWMGQGGWYNGGPSYRAAPAHQYYSSYAPVRQHRPYGFSEWNIEGGVGMETFVKGEAISGDKVTEVPGLVSARTRDMNDIFTDGFDGAVRYELGVSRMLDPNRKFTMTGHIARANGKAFNFANTGGNVITGQISDYNRTGVELGLRQYFQAQRTGLGALRPYVEGRIGASDVSDIVLKDATQLGAAFNGGTVKLYEGGWTPTAAGLVGLETPVARQATLAVETGLRYTGGLKTDASDIGSGHPLEGINDAGGNWSVPLMLRGRYRF